MMQFDTLQVFKLDIVIPARPVTKGVIMSNLEVFLISMIIGIIIYFVVKDIISRS